MLPKIKRCPCCNAINLFQVNGIAYENKFKSLIDWTLKKTIVCRKCGIEFGLFVNNKYKKALEQIVWIDILKCSDNRLDELNKLQKNKEKFKLKNNELKYIKTLKEIEGVLNQIREAKINIKIKAKINNIGMLN
tara:strand:- start:85 stop:486 length:402 start_codon:yes stop_codon:yes gene_type:complete